MHDDDMTQRAHEGRMHAEWPVLALFVAVLGASAAIAAPTPPAHQCSDPCLQAARDARSECLSSASGAFTDAFDACLERDQECIDACRFQLGECRDSSGAAGDLSWCRVWLEEAEGRWWK